MLNVVTEAEGFPAAVLIRAIQPLDGSRTMLARRNNRDTFGPGKLTQAMAITRSQNGIDLTGARSELRIERGRAVPAAAILRGPRVGLNGVPEPWKSKPWRFLVRGWRLSEA
jgi:DNA-3-methyladenine glycosylase